MIGDADNLGSLGRAQHDKPRQECLPPHRLRRLMEGRNKRLDRKRKHRQPGCQAADWLPALRCRPHHGKEGCPAHATSVARTRATLKTGRGKSDGKVLGPQRRIAGASS